MGVIIGVDPHKGSHTAVAIGDDEARLAKVKVRATRRQVDQLLEWAARFEERIWAIESAGGLGKRSGPHAWDWRIRQNDVRMVSADDGDPPHENRRQHSPKRMRTH
jgi:Transposase